MRRALILCALVVAAPVAGACSRKSSGAELPPPPVPFTPAAVTTEPDAARSPATLRGDAAVACDLEQRERANLYPGSGRPPSPNAACTAAAARHDAVVASATRTDSGPDEMPVGTGEAFSCVKTPDDGAWATVLTKLEYKDDAENGGGGFRGVLAIVRLAPDGRVLASMRPPAPEAGSPSLTKALDTTRPNFFASVLTQSSVARPIVFDWDGDGSAEALVTVRVHHHEAGSWYKGRILSFAGGKIVPYAPSASLEPATAFDVDGDGAPDLIVRAPFSGETESLGAGFPFLAEGPPLVAHALPGGAFSLTDDVARRSARCGCPSPQEVTAATFAPDVLGEGLATRAVACARLWGVPEAPLLRAIALGCAPEAGTPLLSPCVQRELLESWAKAAPPLVLAP